MSGPIVLALRILMALALYGFLGWALFFLWKEIQQQGEALANRHIPGINLVINRGHEGQTEKYFSQPEIILGRDPGCDIPLTDETVSNRHTQLSYHHNQWWVADLASTNGTLLNEIAVNMPTVLAFGDEIKCGNARLLVKFLADTHTLPPERLEKPND